MLLSVQRVVPCSPVPKCKKQKKSRCIKWCDDRVSRLCVLGAGGVALGKAPVKPLPAEARWRDDVERVSWHGWGASAVLPLWLRPGLGARLNL